MSDNMKKCLACGAEIGTVDLCSGRTPIAMKEGSSKFPVFHADEAGERRAACGVVVEAVHHANCPLERCPSCHGPLQRCGCMVGSKPAPEEIKLLIKYSPETDELGVFGPMHDKILCYGLLERAKDVVRNAGQPPASGPRLLVPKGGGGH